MPSIDERPHGLRSGTPPGLSLDVVEGELQAASQANNNAAEAVVDILTRVEQAGGLAGSEEQTRARCATLRARVLQLSDSDRQTMGSNARLFLQPKNTWDDTLALFSARVHTYIDSMVEAPSLVCFQRRVTLNGPQNQPGLLDSLSFPVIRRASTSSVQTDKEQWSSFVSLCHATVGRWPLRSSLPAWIRDPSTATLTSLDIIQKIANAGNHISNRPPGSPESLCQRIRQLVEDIENDPEAAVLLPLIKSLTYFEPSPLGKEVNLPSLELLRDLSRNLKPTGQVKQIVQSIRDSFRAWGPPFEASLRTEDVCCIIARHAAGLAARGDFSEAEDKYLQTIKFLNCTFNHLECVKFENPAQIERLLDLALSLPTAHIEPLCLRAAIEVSGRAHGHTETDFGPSGTVQGHFLDRVENLARSPLPETAQIERDQAVSYLFSEVARIVGHSPPHASSSHVIVAVSSLFASLPGYHTSATRPIRENLRRALHPNFSERNNDPFQSDAQRSEHNVWREHIDDITSILPHLPLNQQCALTAAMATSREMPRDAREALLAQARAGTLPADVPVEPTTAEGGLLARVMGDQARDVENVMNAGWTQATKDSVRRLLARIGKSPRPHEEVATLAADLEELVRVTRDPSLVKVRGGAREVDNALCALTREKKALDFSGPLDKEPDIVTLLALVRRAIEAYQGESSTKDSPTPSGTAARTRLDQANMQHGLVMALAGCIEDDGHRVCGVGQQARIVRVLQGYYPEVSIDTEAAVSPNMLLSELADAFNRDHGTEPTPDAVRDFERRAMAAAEQTFAQRPDDLAQFARDLASYLELQGLST